jgi:uncharacterized protein (TIGR02145 family)
MFSPKTVTAICLGVSLCTAQLINISGVVKDNTGSAISGAMVKLESAGLFASTGADGRFTLNGSAATGATNCISTSTPVQIQNGKIFITLSGNTIVTLGIHDVSGKQIYSKKQTYGKGTHAIEASLQSADIYLYKISIGKETYSFKLLPFGTFSPLRDAVLSSTSTWSKRGDMPVMFSDVISIVKEGQLNYRVSIKRADMSGIVIKMIPNAGNVTDIDGNVYQSVRIGNQIWTVENLKTTRYNDGTAIAQVTDSIQWEKLTTGAYCYYENNVANKAKYGALYNWYAVHTGKLAPDGWRVPTDAEWDTLQNYLTRSGYNRDDTTSEDKIARSIAAQADWMPCTVSVHKERCIGFDVDKNNTSGFSALPGGMRYQYGGFGDQGLSAGWWRDTEFNEGVARNTYLFYDDEFLERALYIKKGGFSVRLLRK